MTDNGQSDKHGAGNAPNRLSSDIAERLPDPMVDNVNSIAQLHAQFEQRSGRHQRVIEKATDRLGRPATIWVLLAFISLWIAANLCAPMIGVTAWDRWPFNALQLIATIASLVIAAMILITENRQTKVDERRAHLDLQISLVTEQKITKLISLVEELRKDMPDVRDRTDPEAEAMQQPADPHAVSSAMEYALSGADEISEDELGKSHPDDDTST